MLEETEYQGMSTLTYDALAHGAACSGLTPVVKGLHGYAVVQRPSQCIQHLLHGSEHFSRLTGTDLSEL